MKRLSLFVCLFVLSACAYARKPAQKPASEQVATAPAAVKDLPVRKVVLYKNGVGYFEHAGTVTGDQRVAIDFTSPQLNDVLQSLTVLDEGGGKIAGVNYNSTTPLAEQLKTLSLGMTDDPSSTELFQALRGQRVEITGGPGGVIEGRLMSIETRTEKTGEGENAATVDKYYLTLVAVSGAVRVIELTPQLSVRPLDTGLQGQLDRYLELLSTTHANGLRHLTLNAIGQGQRQLRVSYISEVPVWKSTYRIVFPRADGKEGENAIVQGWAVVDNTVGADWDNVQLSLVAGSPQSFIQPLSQPLYTRRPEIPIATGAMTTPQTHESGATGGAGAIAGMVMDQTGAVIPGATVTVTNLRTNASITRESLNNGQFTIGALPPGQYMLRAEARGFQTYVQRNIGVGAATTATVNANLTVGSEAETVEVTVGNETAPAVPAPMMARADRFTGGWGTGANVGGGVYRASDALSEGDVSTSAFDDFFEYSLAAPVTIHKNESAMVPILQQELPAEHVTLWSAGERSPWRAVWLENQSKVTLDSGSFSIFENGEFAGEGLLEPIHPGEKRILSYAADQAIKVHADSLGGEQRVHHLSIHKGSVVETYMDVTGTSYNATNSGDEDRTVLIEYPRHTGVDGWTLEGDLKPAETTATLYRMRLAVAAHTTAKLEVREHGPQYVTVDLRANPQQRDFVLQLAKQVPNAAAQLQPILDAQNAVADLDEKIAASKAAEQTAAADEARDRENVTALKGSDAAKRFIDELNRAEDELQAARKQTADLEKQRASALEKLDAVIAGLSFDWNEVETK